MQLVSYFLLAGHIRMVVSAKVQILDKRQVKVDQVDIGIAIDGITFVNNVRYIRCGNGKTANVVAHAEYMGGRRIFYPQGILNEIVVSVLELLLGRWLAEHLASLQVANEPVAQSHRHHRVA